MCDFNPRDEGVPQVFFAVCSVRFSPFDILQETIGGSRFPDRFVGNDLKNASDPGARRGENFFKIFAAARSRRRLRPSKTPAGRGTANSPRARGARTRVGSACTRWRRT